MILLSKRNTHTNCRWVRCTRCNLEIFAFTVWGDVKMGFWEELPGQCPPAEAQDIEIETAYRVVFSNPPKEEHFRSNRFLNKPMAGVGDECRHASCSLCTTIERARKFSALPKVKPKGPFIAKVAIPQGGGMSLLKNDHIDLWIYDDFDPLTAVIAVEQPQW